MKKYARKCTKCSKVFNEGYCIEGGEEYYCTKDCLLKAMTYEEFLKLYANGLGDSYYTTWEDEEDFQYYADGSEVEE